MFKYAAELGGIDTLADYGMDIGPDTRKVTNPARVAARKTVAAAEAELATAERALAQLLAGHPGADECRAARGAQADRGGRRGAGTCQDGAARPASGGLVDLILRTPIVFSLGYMKPMPGLPFGSAANAAFGTPGNGGSFGMADPDTGIGYCYAPNRLGFGLVDQREIALRDALYRDVLGERSQCP